MEKSAWTRYETRAEELLSAMGNQEVKPDTGDQEAKPEKKRFYKILLQNILVTCCGILAIAAAGKGFLYLDTKINAVPKDLNTPKAHMTAPDTKEQLAAVTAEVEHLKATNIQLRAEVKNIRDTLEALKARKNNVVPAQRKRR